MKKILYMLWAALMAVVRMIPVLQPDLQRFAEGGDVVNTTGGTVNAYTGEQTPSDAMTPGMKTYYDTELLENARDEAVYGQLGKSQTLPANHGKSVEWRKWNTLPEPDKLQEGVIPKGKTFGQSSLNVGIAQYGEYVTVSDQLELHHVDDVILGATEEVGAAMGKKADLLTRDAILAGCSNVMYAPDAAGAQPSQLFGVKADCLFTTDVVARAVTILKKGNAPTIDGKYVAVIHPSVAYDLRKDPQWINYHQYDASTEIFNGEIGELHGVRFVESNSAPVMVGDALFGEAQRYLTMEAYNAGEPGLKVEYGMTGTHMVNVKEAIGECEVDWSAMVGQYVLLCDGGQITHRMQITGVDPLVRTLYVSGGPASLTVASGADFLLPGNGGAETKDSGPVPVYATMFFGKDAFGVVDPAGAGMEMIIKNKDKAGGPLNQFSTIGGKMSHAAKVLYPERMLCVYSCSSLAGTDEANWRAT